MPESALVDYHGRRAGRGAWLL